MSDEREELVFDFAKSEKALRDARQNLEMVNMWAARELLKRIGGEAAKDILQPIRGEYETASGSKGATISAASAEHRHIFNVIGQARVHYEGAHADYREALRQREKSEADAFAASVKKLSEEQVDAAKAQVTAANALNAHTEGLKRYTVALVAVGLLQVIAMLVVAFAGEALTVKLRVSKLQLVIIGLVAVFIALVAFATRTPRSTPPPTAAPTASATTGRDEAADVIARCGAPQRDYLENANDGKLRHVVYQRANLELIYMIADGKPSQLVGRFPANSDPMADTVSLAEANRRLPCAHGAIRTVLEAP